MLKLKHKNLKNPIFAPFFEKKKFLENWQIIGHKKHTKWQLSTNKSPETRIFIVQN